MRLQNFLESKVNKHRKGIKVYWWRPAERGKRNFGDEVTPVIIEKIWHTRCLWTRLADCEMVGAGSIVGIVNTYNPTGHSVQIWGSGFIEDGPEVVNHDLKFHLVRGPLTAKRVSEKKQIPCGDPGLLVSRAFTASNSKTHKIGIVPHMRDLDSDEVAQLRDHCLIISPYQSPEKVAKDITSCEVVFSSSLHGLIFADSFNVPNFRIKHALLEGDDYKFDDYYRSTDRQPKRFTVSEVIDMVKSDKKIRQVKGAYSPVANLNEMQDIIEAAFPYRDRALVAN